MGRSSGKKKKGAGASSSITSNPVEVESSTADNNKNKKSSNIPVPYTTAAAAPPTVPSAATNFLKRAHELKEEGNRRFQAKDYSRALEQYDQALKLTPLSHPDRAVFYSNRAACLMQMRPVDHHAVAAECSLALQAQPSFPRALLRRARALDALGSHDLAYLDVQALLASDPTQRDALELSSRLQSILLPSRNHQQQLPSRPSPAALGASAVRGAPIAGMGPCLPSRPVPKKSSSSSSSPLSPSAAKQPPPAFFDSLPNGPKPPPAAAVALKPSKRTVTTTSPNPTNRQQTLTPDAAKSARLRPLKLVYDHDIRLAEMPAKCSFRMLREIVTKRFPSSKSVLIKYKDSDSDLVTITSTAELRSAESYIDQLASVDANEEKKERDNTNHVFKMLRLHIVEVNPEQEPPLLEEEQVQQEEEEEDMEEKPIEDDGLVKGDESLSNSSNGDLVLESVDNNGPVKSGSEEEAPKAVVAATRDNDCNHAECKEAEIDDWLFEFAQLFRTHIGIDPDAHLDLHELGMELCTEALEETVTSEEAQNLFDMAAAKFQEVAALAFFNWGNIHMCAARKRIPLDDSACKEVMTAELQSAYDWVQEKYTLAGQKYEESLRIKPDFYEGLLAVGQQHFENAKLQWSFAVANKVDLKSWDSSETIQLFNGAEEKMKAATEMWEKLEEQRVNELKDPGTSKKDEFLRRKKKLSPNADGQSSMDVHGELSPNEAAEQAAVMRSQIHLFWGNMLFERSQVEFKLGFSGWKKNLDAAVERFKLAGASEADIAVVLKNHSSKEVGIEFVEKKVTDSNITEASIKDEDKHVLESCCEW